MGGAWARCVAARLAAWGMNNHIRAEEPLTAKVVTWQAGFQLRLCCMVQPTGHQERHTASMLRCGQPLCAGRCRYVQHSHMAAEERGRSNIAAVLR